MRHIYKILPWKRAIYASVAVLLCLILFNFYGLYTNKFYFLKPDNYVFPIVAIVHFLYLYVVWFKITEKELPDPKMRNIEYVLYAVMAVYVYKIVDTLLILLSYSDYDDHVIPSTFIPLGILILFLHLLLPLLALLCIKYRQIHIGKYNFENFNDNMNYWNN
ncbi:MAG: hypothetical protein ED555_11645 [Allomuricauda sp.]|nr:MAG: hypothetical protein ED555_11645 [Allomuricauda sp.]